MTRFQNSLFVVSFSAALALTPAMAQKGAESSSSAMGKKSAAVTMADTTFVKKAARGGLAEVELGKLATEKASNEDVKKFGQRMVDDHGKANDELKQVAAEEHIKLPTTLSVKDKATKDKLAKLSGEQFDRAYMRDMVTDHKQDVAEFERESKSAHDPAIKDFATKTLPTLQDHLKEAEKIAPTQKTAQNLAK